jgi:molecular chaperone DnaK
MAEKLYAQQGGAAGAGAESASDAGASGSSQSSAEDDVVDAEFEEVQDDKKS